MLADVPVTVIGYVTRGVVARTKIVRTLGNVLGFVGLAGSFVIEKQCFGWAQRMSSCATPRPILVT